VEFEAVASFRSLDQFRVMDACLCEVHGAWQNAFGVMFRKLAASWTSWTWLVEMVSGTSGSHYRLDRLAFRPATTCRRLLEVSAVLEAWPQIDNRLIDPPRTFPA
jgi:hypothetical protein